MDKSPSEFDPRIHWAIPVSSPPEDILKAFTQELKHPLNTIKGSLLLLSGEAAEEVRPRAHELISQSTEKIEWLMETIKAYLKIRQDALRESSKNASPEEKLAAMRNLMLGPAQTVRENVTVLRIKFEHGSISPEDIGNLLKRLDKASEDIVKILDELTL